MKGSPKVGTWNYPQASEDALLSGRLYVNIHSATSPGGEIRGQIVPVVVPSTPSAPNALRLRASAHCCRLPRWRMRCLPRATTTLR